MSKVLMIQGSMSNVGKSIVVAGLCRVFKRRGVNVSPFKSQNMALNSYITKDGLEIGRAQAIQAEAAKIEPSYLMNPILLKPVTNSGSQIIVKGIVEDTLKAVDYYKRKEEFLSSIKECYEELEKSYDLIIIEGAGSPSEINLKSKDYVNMGLARMVNSPVLIVGDIDRGGVFAQLYGTIELLEECEKKLVKGVIINKFRGDLDILKPGLKQLEDLVNVPVIGTLPMLDIDIEEEDSQSSVFSSSKTSLLDIVVIKLKHMSNYSDFTALSAQEEVGLRYVDDYRDVGNPDLIIIPGTKNTIDDMLYLRTSGLEAILLKAADKNIPILGICGGYQIMGNTIIDDCIEESGYNEINGLSLLPIVTKYEKKKSTVQIKGSLKFKCGIFKDIERCPINGYEIHMGISTPVDTPSSIISIGDREDGYQIGNCYGTYTHGLFDNDKLLREMIKTLCSHKGIDIDDTTFNYQEYKERQYDKLADCLEEYLDFDLLDKIIDDGIDTPAKGWIL